MAANKANTSKPILLRGIDPDLWKIVKSQAARAGITVADYVAEALRKAVRKAA